MVAQKIIVGMSGGVDSSVAAFLLKEQGYLVEGLFMKNWEGDDNEDHCPASIDYADAQAVCDKLNITLHTVNFSNDYWDNVFTYFLSEYQQGRTPNPDILCNKEIKFKSFLNYAKELGATKIATGHYARAEQGQLKKGIDDTKDQSYFLYALGSQELTQTLFPLGELPKSTVRKIALERGLINHDKKDSTGICFIGERRFKTFLSQYLPAKTGHIETSEGERIGTHEGLMYYTIGQRKGIGIGGQQNKLEEPWYVADKDLDRNVLIVVQGHNHPLLLKNSLTFSQAHWISGMPPTFPFVCTAKTRYRQHDQSCIIEQMDDHAWRVSFTTPQRAITPGQSVVFYDKDICLGGGIIIK